MMTIDIASMADIMAAVGKENQRRRQDAIERAAARISELEQEIAILTSIRDAMQKALEHHEACNE